MKQLIKLEQLIWLIPQETDITLFHSGLILSGKADALSIMCREEILQKEVTNIEAENNQLKIWIVA